jgi:hypothetical protein
VRERARAGRCFAQKTYSIILRKWDINTDFRCGSLWKYKNTENRCVQFESIETPKIGVKLLKRIETPKIGVTS